MSPPLRSHSKATVAAVMFGCFMAQTGLGFGYVFAVTLKNIVSEFDWSRLQYSAASTSLLLTMALSSPLVGRATARFGGRAVASLAVVMLGTAMILFSHMQNLWQFFAINMLFGIGMTGVGDIVAGSVASTWVSGRRRGLTLAVVYLGSNAGGMLVPVIAQSLSSLYDWRFALQAMGFGGIICILPFTLLLIREPAGTIANTPHENTEAIPDTQDLNLSQAIQTRSFWILGFLLFSFYFYYLAINKHIIAYLTDVGFADAKAAASFSFAIGMGIFGKLAIGWFADRTTTKAALLINFALLCTASILLLGVTLPWVLPAYLMLHGFAVAAENVLLPLIVVFCFGVRHMATIYGMLMMMLFPGGILGPILAAYIFDVYGSYQYAFIIFATLNMLGLLGLLYVRNERPAAQKKTAIDLRSND